MDCNSGDRCQRQKQGADVGAAASRMQGSLKSRCSRWVPQPVFRVRRETTGLSYHHPEHKILHIPLCSRGKTGTMEKTNGNRKEVLL